MSRVSRVGFLLIAAVTTRAFSDCRDGDGLRLSGAEDGRRHGWHSG